MTDKPANKITLVVSAIEAEHLVALLENVIEMSVDMYEFDDATRAETHGDTIVAASFARSTLASGLQRYRRDVIAWETQEAARAAREREARLQAACTPDCPCKMTP